MTRAPLVWNGLRHVSFRLGASPTLDLRTVRKLWTDELLNTRLPVKKLVLMDLVGIPKRRTMLGKL